MGFVSQLFHPYDPIVLPGSQEQEPFGGINQLTPKVAKTANLNKRSLLCSQYELYQKLIAFNTTEADQQFSKLINKCSSFSFKLEEHVYHDSLLKHTGRFAFVIASLGFKLLPALLYITYKLVKSLYDDIYGANSIFSTAERMWRIFTIAFITFLTTTSCMKAGMLIGGLIGAAFGGIGAPIGIIIGLAVGFAISRLMLSLEKYCKNNWKYNRPDIFFTEKHCFNQRTIAILKDTFNIEQMTAKNMLSFVNHEILRIKDLNQIEKANESQIPKNNRLKALRNMKAELLKGRPAKLISYIIHFQNTREFTQLNDINFSEKVKQLSESLKRCYLINGQAAKKHADNPFSLNRALEGMGGVNRFGFG